MNALKDLTQLIFVDGHAYINLGGNTGGGQPAARLALKISGSSVPFHPCNDASVTDLCAVEPVTYFDINDIALRSVSVPAETSPGERFACWVNKLPDWALSGSQTLQLMITRRDEPCEIRLGEPVRIAAASTPQSFKVALAAHRAKAVLNVDVTTLGSGETRRKRIAFDTRYKGGTLLSGYHTATVPLPASTQGQTISLSVEYQSYVSDGVDIEPFLFLADARITPVVSARKPTATSPSVVISRSRPRPGGWFSAPFPAIPAKGEELEITVDGRQTELIAAPSLALSIRENYGHTLILGADSAAELLLFIDGECLDRLHVTPGDTILRMPVQSLDGADHHIALKDVSGSFTYLETVLLVPAIITPADVIQRETAPPFPDAIFAQTARRYASVKQQIARGGAETDFGQISYALSVLEGGYERVRLKPLRFTRPAQPDVSIIIPAHNKVEVTYLALCSLLVAYNEASFEVIVVDDASTDDTARLEEIVSGITVLHNKEALRFIRACNAGAELAQGRYIVLLNNDVEVTSGWLDELVATFGRFDRVGLAGSKLLYPDGKLQDAGGIIWGSGNPWNYGNRQNPNAPSFSYARQADYLSGAALMIPAELWRQIGGLSSYLEPMYFEDTDLSFKVREAGYTTWFTPSSVVYHYEGMTSGTDTSKGFKRFQEVNRPKFKRRWAREYSTFGQEGKRPDLEKDRGIIGRVLFIDYSTPRGDQDAGSYAALSEIRLVQSLGYKVTLLPMNMAHLGSYSETLQKMGVEVIYAPFFLSPSEYLGSHARDFDAFYITRYYVAQDVLPQLKALAPDTKIIFNNADLHFLREIRAARADNDPAMLEKAMRTRTEELAIIRQVDVVLSYNVVEHSVIHAYTDGQSRVLHCPWVVEIPQTPAGIEGRAGLSFLGSFRHHPNEAAVRWFAKEVAPLLPDDKAFRLSVYGSGLTDRIRALESSKIAPIGFVPEIASAFDRHRIFVAPLQSGAGIKGKVLSALAHGVPCVLTPVAAEGIGLRSGHDCLIVETPEEWRTAIMRLTQDDRLWQAMAENAMEYMRAAFSFAQGREHMRKAFEAVDLFQSRD